MGGNVKAYFSSKRWKKTWNAYAKELAGDEESGESTPERSVPSALPFPSASIRQSKRLSWGKRMV